MHETVITVIGNLVADPVRRELATGGTNVTLRIASTERRWSTEEGRHVDGRTSFYGVTCWGYLADNVAMSLRKGERVIVHGKVSVREYTDAQDRPRTSIDIEARAVGHDLTFGTSNYTRFVRAATDPWRPAEAEVDGVALDEEGQRMEVITG